MEITITSRVADVPEAVRQHTEDKLRRLDRIEQRPAHAHVYFDSERGEKKVEIKVSVAGRGDYVANGFAANYRAALDQSVERLLEQIKRDKERTRERTRSKESPRR
jgi:ribosomal subunit interface protein